MYLIALSSSAARGSVAIADASGTLAVECYEGLAAHAELLFAAMDKALARSGLQKRQLGAVACDIGPGSFTGVRVATAAGLGLGLALSIPVVGVGSLEAMAFAAFEARPELEEVVAVLDARKEEAFIAAYDRQLREVVVADHLVREAGVAVLRARSHLGAQVVGEHARTWGFANEPSETSDWPHAALIARLAHARVEGGDLAPAVPRYVRPPDAKPPRR